MHMQNNVEKNESVDYKIITHVPFNKIMTKKETL